MKFWIGMGATGSGPGEEGHLGQLEQLVSSSGEEKHRALSVAEEE